jgi:hypothetical protein
MRLFLTRLEIAQLARGIARNTTFNERATLSKKRDELLDLIQTFDTEAMRYLGDDAYAEITGFVGEQIDDFDENGDPIDLATEPIIPADGRPELLAIALPSAIPHTSPHRAQIDALIKSEFELRQGHANDALASIRQIIGHQSFQFKNLLRPAQGKVHNTRARTAIQSVYCDLTLKAQIYRRTRQAMESLGLEPELLVSTYRGLLRSDLHVSAAVGDPNQRGLSQTGLSWIWRTVQDGLSPDNYITECNIYTFPWAFLTCHF